MPEVVSKLSCGACGKSYAWKPQYAGKTLKCSCGSMIKAPAAPMASAGAARRPAAAPVAPPPPDLSAADEFERALSGAYDTAEDSAPPPPPSGTRYQPAASPAPAPRQNKGTSFAQARPVDYETPQAKKSSNILSSPVFVGVGAVVAVVVLMVVIVNVLRIIKPAQKHIYQTSRSVTTFEGTKEIKKQLAPDETIDANGNVVKKAEQKEIDFRTVQLTGPGEQETADQKRIAGYLREAKRRDEEIKKTIATPKAVAEARDWLDVEKHPGHQPPSGVDLMKQVNDLYDAGAKMVWVTDIAGWGTKFEFCSSFIVEMPSGTDNETFQVRKQIIATRNQYHPALLTGEDKTDWGNDYLKFPCVHNVGDQLR